MMLHGLDRLRMLAVAVPGRPGRGSLAAIVLLVLRFCHPGAVLGQQVVLSEQKPDPHGFPRPARGARDVPLRTSYYLELKLDPAETTDSVDPASVAIELQPEGGEAVPVLQTGRRFARGYSGRLAPRQDMAGKASLAINIESEVPLRAATTYTIQVAARSRKGAGLTPGKGTWSFTTEAEPRTHEVAFAVDLAAPAVAWHGAFFSGFCNVIFCTDAASFGKTFELMAEARRSHPRAWSLQRDFWMTGTEHQPQFFPNRLPNIVRERETRRIAALEPRDGEVVLRVEDVFGHRQYGVDSDRPLERDYHPGDEVLVADGVHSARARVVGVDDPQKTVRVSSFETPEGGWKIAYAAPLPTREDPDAPGLFPTGGCYLRKLNPHGTPCYYWSRLDKEWDLAHRRYGRRLFVNFADAAGDLSRDGRSWTTVKDYVEWHDVVGKITGHLIDRYGTDALEFVWSIFNEPDLGGLFWRADWNELQTFYDYTVDAILRAFEDRGLDSNRVFVGGLELGGIFGTHLRLREFLAHCSPRAQARGAVPRNAAVADRRLDGKRSRRVEALCPPGDAERKGTPCDFISIHSYNRSQLMADKLIGAKEEALEIDPEFYRGLWVNSHEACPEWNPPPDTAAADSYLGNGYFPTWCADVAARQLRRAAADPRFRFGETILTVWPPNRNFRGMNAVTRNIDCDDDGDGRKDRVVTVPMPIFHVLGLLSDMGPNYQVLPARQVGGHLVSGFLSSDAKKRTRVLLYTHHDQDTQSRSGAEFQVNLELGGLDGRDWKVTEYRFDKEHNSYFQLGRTLRDRASATSGAEASPDRLEAILRDLDRDDPRTQRAALDALARLGNSAASAVPELFKRLGRFRGEVQAAAKATLERIVAEPAYPRAEVERVQEQASLRATGTATRRVVAGKLPLSARLAGNGLSFLIVEPAP